MSYWSGVKLLGQRNVAAVELQIFFVFVLNSQQMPLVRIGRKVLFLYFPTDCVVLQAIGDINTECFCWYRALK